MKRLLKLPQIVFKRDGPFLEGVGDGEIPHVCDVFGVRLPQTHQVTVVGQVPRVLVRVCACEETVARLVHEVQGLSDRSYAVKIRHECALAVVQSGTEKWHIVMLLEKND